MLDFKGVKLKDSSILLKFLEKLISFVKNNKLNNEVKKLNFPPKISYKSGTNATKSPKN
jgi:hypothetical protein